MKLEQMSKQAGDGLIEWAKFQHGDELFFDGIGSLPSEWAWVVYQLKVAEDRPEWFPKGKSATIQKIEMSLYEVAKREVRK
jgi:hypoxanthine phosphoribosyltransferase